MNARGKIQVEDNDDLQLALANALKNSQELTFHIKTSKSGKPNFAKKGEKGDKVRKVRDPADKDTFKNLKALIIKELEGKTIAGFVQEIRDKSYKKPEVAAIDKCFITPQEQEEIKQNNANKSVFEGFDYTKFIKNKGEKRERGERGAKKFRVNKNVVNEFGQKMLELSNGSQD